ncbi:MAG TPA: LUD domain-containing protein [Moheibacter sp.]|nr:LUD domain-containing protein [Moheibacter sp.]
MWKKIKQFLAPPSEETENEDSELEFVSFQTKDPIDVLFTKNFIAGGGIFFYCSNEQEVLENLRYIAENESIEDVLCFDHKLKSLLDRVNIKQNNSLNAKAEFAFIECEYLVAFDGAIMLSSHQTNGRKQEDLPHNVIIYASPGQLVSNISEALQRLKSNKSDNIPTNITSIRGKNLHNVDSSSNAKNIYLLLVEQL